MTAKVFVSYSHKDSKWLETIRKYLAPRGIGDDGLDLWADTRIPVGSEWFEEIENAIKSSSHSVLLVSQDFLDSKFIWEHELPQLIKMRESGSHVFWVPVRPSTVDKSVLGKLQAVWDKSKPLSALSRPLREMALVQIADAIRQATQTSLNDGGGMPPPPRGTGLPPLSMDILHSLIDREPQEMFFVDVAQQRRLNKGSNILLVPYSIADCPDLLIDRIKEYTFPLYLNNTAKTINVPFPKAAESAGKALKSYVLNVLAAGNTKIHITEIGTASPAEISAMEGFRKQIENRDCVFWTLIRPDEPDDFQKALILECINWWMNFKLTETVYPIVLLFFQRRAVKPGKFADEVSELAANCGWLTGCLDQFSNGSGPRILESLRSITLGDVEDWLLRDRIAESFDMAGVRRQAEILFNDCPLQPMKMIRDAYDDDWKKKIVPRKA